MSYPRKRAPIACNYCRHRKRKCDGNTPTCSLCRESGNRCEYLEVPTERRPDGDLVRRLDELTALVLRQSEAIDSLTKASQHHNPESNHFSGSTELADHASSVQDLPWTDFPPDQSSWQVPPASETGRDPRPVNSDGGEDVEYTPFTIPMGHQSTTGSLFSVPQLKALLGNYAEDFFLRLESHRDLPFQAFTSGVDINRLEFNREDTEPLVGMFFSFIYPHAPMLTPDIFMPIYERVLQDGVNRDPPSALFLTVLALGKLATQMVTGEVVQQWDSLAGNDYFSLAYHIAVTEWGACFRLELALPLTLVYCAVYLLYVLRPLQAWKLVSLASSNLQVIMASDEGKHTTPAEAACIDRLCWACYIYESDVLAEFHLPRSGIELVVDKMPFPHFSSPTDRDGALFLALCSIRRLFNRIHSTLYARNTTGAFAPSPTEIAASPTAAKSPLALSAPSLERICVELSRQLDIWYKSLPGLIKPNFEDDIPVDVNDGWLRLRYWSAQHIISRPWLLYATSFTQEEDVPPGIMEYCVICVQSCRSCINIAHYLRKQQTPYSWVVVQGLVAYGLVLSIASSSPLLKDLVPDISELLSRVIQTIQPYGTPNSTAEFGVWMMQIIQRKQFLENFRVVTM